jgi:hypothetical protein
MGEHSRYSHAPEVEEMRLSIAELYVPLRYAIRGELLKVLLSGAIKRLMH